jgi:hypothetical protein
MRAYFKARAAVLENMTAGSTNRKYRSFSLLLGEAAQCAFHDPQGISRLESLVF